MLLQAFCADGGIALSFLPMYQTSFIDNFIARETAPSGILLPQVWFDSELGIVVDEPQRAIGRTLGRIKSMGSLRGRSRSGNDELALRCCQSFN